MGMQANMKASFDLVPNNVCPKTPLKKYPAIAARIVGKKT
jgi:hypothetical protein